MKNINFFRFAETIIFCILCVVGGGKLIAQCPQNYFPPAGNVRINSIFEEKKLTIGGNNICPDVAIQLRYDTESNFLGHLALITNESSTYSANITPGDIILHADATAEDIVLSTRNNSAYLRFCTTEPNKSDIERLTITNFGKIGVSSPIPKNLFSAKRPIGLDYWGDSENFQDLRFNVYHTNKVGISESIDSSEVIDNTFYSGHKNIMIGYSSIIQARNTTNYGSLLFAVTGQKTEIDQNLEFFEYLNDNPKPKGIMLLNYDEMGYDYTNTGIASIPERYSRLTIQGRTDDNTMNALKIKNSIDETLFVVRNDGNIGIGTDNPNKNLVVNGTICAKEVIVQLSGIPCWGDYVFDEEYKLMPLEELERWVKKEKQLPEIPSATQISNNGIPLGELQTILVKKIEELTLYLFELKRENEELRNRIEILENK